MSGAKRAWRIIGRVCSFVMVNQVLVRLWARVIDADPLDWRGSRRSVACLTGKAVLMGQAPQRSAARVQRRVKILFGWWFRQPREWRMG